MDDFCFRSSLPEGTEFTVVPFRKELGSLFSSSLSLCSKYSAIFFRLFCLFNYFRCQNKANRNVRAEY